MFVMMAVLTVTSRFFCSPEYSGTNTPNVSHSFPDRGIESVALSQMAPGPPRGASTSTEAARNCARESDIRRMMVWVSSTSLSTPRLDRKKPVTEDGRPNRYSA